MLDLFYVFALLLLAGAMLALVELCTRLRRPA